MDTKFRLFSFLSVALFVVCSYATLVLEELKPWDLDPSVPHKRDSTIYNLVSSETWLWGPGGGSNEVLGNLTVLKPADNENLLSLERFSSTLESIKCEPTTLTFTFKDEQTFQYAKAAWGWVNGAPNRTFLAIPSNGDCDGNEFRVPYNVNSLRSNDPARIVTLDATLGTWQELANSYELRVGSVNDLDTPSKAATRRDLSKSASIGIGADYTFSTSVGPVSLGCSPCNSAGTLDFVFTLRQNWLGIPDGADFSVRPHNVEFTAGFSLGLSEGVSGGTNKSDETLPLIDIPLPGGLSILGDIFSVGPQLIGELGWSLSAKDSVSASIKATATISDSAILQADLGDFSNNHFSGWVPHVEWGPLQVQAKEAVKFQIFVGITAQLQATVLGKGVEVGILLKAPYFQIEGDLLVAITNGACKPGDGKDAAVKVIPSYGIEVDLDAGFVGGGKQATFAIASANYPMATLCEPFDLPGGGGGSGPASSTLPGPTPPPGSPSTPNTCTVNGVAGTCIDVSTCESGGKVATPGYCPNDPNNVECCTPKSSSNPPPSSQPHTCTVNGVAGTCIDVNTCKSGGKVATPGYCPNDPNNVECCTPKSSSNPPPSSQPHTCTINGVAGTCIDVSTCEGSGKVATPGYCPNDPNNVECCTPKSTLTNPNTCTVKGTPGTCIDVSACESSGKVATAGYCPNDPNNVECCTPKSASTNPNTCTVKGTPGTCIDVSACESSGKVATAGYCPNDPNNVECCTPKSASTTPSNSQPKPTSSSPPAGPQPNKCTVQGKSGICVDVTECKNNGDTATPGFCPKDPENVQCCTGSTKMAPIIYNIGGYGNACSVNGQAGTCLDKSACASAGKVATPGYCPTDPENVQCCTAHATTPSKDNCGPPQCNQATVNLISGFEGFRANVYTDATGNSEIGYGHLCQNAKCPGLGYSIPLSEADGKKLLASDMAVAEKCITEMMNDKVTLNMNEYGALVSWAFNVGCGGAQSSTLIKRLNNGEEPTVVLPAELVKWVDGNNGQVIPGLVKRRDAEIALSKTATSDPGLPPKC